MNKSNVLKAGIVSTVLLATVLGTNVKVFGATNDVIKDVKYVNSTLVDFDCNKYNAKMRNLSKQRYDGLSQDEKARVDQNMMLFGMCYGLVSNGHSNQFVEPNIPRKVDGVSWNLAKSKLEDNNLKIVDSLKNGTTFFPKNATIGNEYVQALNNWKEMVIILLIVINYLWLRIMQIRDLFLNLEINMDFILLTMNKMILKILISVIYILLQGLIFHL